MKFKAPTSLEIFRRHEGPYTLCVVKRLADGKIKSKWQSLIYVRGEDADKAARGWLEEEDTAWVCVWTESGQYFVTTFTRTDNDG